MENYFCMPPQEGVMLPMQPGYPTFGGRRGRGRGRGGSHRHPYTATAGATPRATTRPPKIEDRGVKRARECPSAARMYLLESNDIATGDAVCSAVLGVPSASAAAAVSATTTSLTTRAPSPISVYMMWADTTLLEVAMQALRAARPWADKQFADAAAAKARVEEEMALANTRDAVPSEENGQEGSGGIGKGAGPCTAVHHRATGETAEEEEPVLPHYSVELLCGYVDGEGKAVVHGLGTVELRQVLPSRPELVFPVRLGRGAVDYNAVATELGFGYGNPILFSCARIK